MQENKAFSLGTSGEKQAWVAPILHDLAAAKTAQTKSPAVIETVIHVTKNLYSYLITPTS